MINRLFIDYPYFVKQNPVKINSADPVDTIMSMGRYEIEKLFMSVVRKYHYAWASRNGKQKYIADRSIRDVEKHLNNHFKNERDLMDTLVYFVEEGAIVPTKKSMTSNKSNGDGITMSKKFTIKASRSVIRRRAIKASDSRDTFWSDGKWSIYRDGNEIVISDGWMTDYAEFNPDGTVHVAGYTPEMRVPKYKVC